MIPESQVIEGCKRRKRKSFNALYTKYASTMLGVCMRYCKTQQEAEDVLQEGFIKVFNKINTFEGRGSLEGWIRRIMVNTSINNYKTNVKHYYHEDIDNDSVTKAYQVDEDVNIQIDYKIKNDQVIELLQGLPVGYQLVFNMYVIDGLTHKEIANELCVSVNTSKSQLFKA